MVKYAPSTQQVAGSIPLAGSILHIHSEVIFSYNLLAFFKALGKNYYFFCLHDIKTTYMDLYFYFKVDWNVKMNCMLPGSNLRCHGKQNFVNLAHCKIN